MRSTARRALVRSLFIATPVFFAAQIGADHYLRQPYPAIYQPSFGAITPADRSASTTEPVVVATYPDGSTADFDHRDVAADARVLPSFILQAAFGQDTPRRTDPDNAAWLAERLTELGDGRVPSAATIEWRSTTRDLTGHDAPVTTVSRSVDVALPGGAG